MEVVLRFDNGTKLSMAPSKPAGRVILTLEKEGQEPDTAAITVEALVHVTALLIEIAGTYNTKQRM
jgi:hypothetical protein